MTNSTAMGMPSTRPRRAVTAVERRVLVKRGHQWGRCRSMLPASAFWRSMDRPPRPIGAYESLTSALVGVGRGGRAVRVRLWTRPRPTRSDSME